MWPKILSGIACYTSRARMIGLVNDRRAITYEEDGPSLDGHRERERERERERTSKGFRRMDVRVVASIQKGIHVSSQTATTTTPMMMGVTSIVEYIGAKVGTMIGILHGEVPSSEILDGLTI